MKIAEAFVEIRADMSKLKGDLDKAVSLARSAVGKLGGAVSKIGTLLKSVFSNLLKWVKRLALGFTALSVAVGVLAVRAFQKQELAERKVAAALRANGDEVEQNLRVLKRYAAEIQKVTVHGDEFTLELMAMMRSLGVLPQNLTEAAKTAIGLSTALGQDVNSMARYVALAQMGEFTMLRRYIPALRGTTDAAEQLKIVMDAGARGFQQAQEEAETSTGKMTQLKNAFGDLMEEIGSVIAGGKGLGNTGDRLIGVMQELGQWINKNAQAIRDGFVDAFRAAVSAVSSLVTAFDDLFGISDYLGQFQDIEHAVSMMVSNIQTQIELIPVTFKQVLAEMELALFNASEALTEFLFGKESSIFRTKSSVEANRIEREALNTRLRGLDTERRVIEGRGAQRARGITEDANMRRGMEAIRNMLDTVTSMFGGGGGVAATPEGIIPTLVPAIAGAIEDAKAAAGDADGPSRLASTVGSIQTATGSFKSQGAGIVLLTKIAKNTADTVDNTRGIGEDFS